MSLLNIRSRYILALFTGFFIPISTALTNIFCALVLLFILFNVDYRKELKDRLKHPIAITALFLFTLMLAGIFYSPASFSDSVRILSKYREFLYIPLFMLLFHDNLTRLWGLYGFLSSMALTLFLSYFTAITGWEIIADTIKNHAVFKNYITQNLLMALAAYFITIQLWTEEKWKWLRGLVLFFAIYNILFMSLGRTGYLVLFCLILLLFYQLYHLRGVIISGIALAVISIILFSTSAVIQQRLNNIANDLQRYEQGQIDGTNSIGSRIQYYQNSIVLISQNPIWGAGTGSFVLEYKKLAEYKKIQTTTNPHNEFLIIAVQWGLMGLGLFIYLLYSMWKTSHNLEKQQQFMAQGLFVSIVVGCFFNSFWLDSTEGHIFAFLIGLLYGKQHS
jgi:O-antigen ligase